MNKKYRVVFEFKGEDGYFDMEAMMKKHGTTPNDYEIVTALIDGDMRELWIPKVNDLRKTKPTASTGT